MKQVHGKGRGVGRWKQDVEGRVECLGGKVVREQVLMMRGENRCEDKEYMAMEQEIRGQDKGRSVGRWKQGVEEWVEGTRWLRDRC